MGINIAVFVHEITLGPQLEPFIRMYGWVPAKFSQAFHQGTLPSLTPLLTSMFLHGGWLHLFGNLLYLHIFGGSIEDRLGHFRYVIFYCVGGAVAVLVQTYIAPSSSTPMIGASGAIAAVTGAYLIFYPTARVLTLIPLLFSFPIVQIPAVFYLLLWLFLQIVSGMHALSPQGQELTGVAWWAHIGGFTAGLTLAPLFLLRQRRFRRVRLHPPLLWHNPRSALR